jgi:hypothetical protein
MRHRTRGGDSTILQQDDPNNNLLDFGIATNSSFEGGDLSIEDPSVLLEDEPRPAILPQNLEIQGIQSTISALQYMTIRPSPA